MKKPTLATGQKGFVSIIITMIIMIVISLIVLGFAQVTRREQRQALDRQLSTQAFYAAETGINVAVNAIQKQGYNTEKANCGPDAAGPLSATNVLDAANGVQYSCLLIDPSPNSLEYTSIDTDQSTVIPITPAAGTLSRIAFSWQDKTGNSTFSGCPAPTAGQFTLPAVAAWPATCNAGILRIDLVPKDVTITRAGLASRTLSAFLYPQNGGTNNTTFTYNLNSPDQGAIIAANCNSASAPRKCNVSIQLSSASGTGTFYARVRSIYKSSAMTVTAYDAGNQQLDLINAQASVDSTGKANDVLRRIAVRVPLSSIGNGVPSFAIQTSDSICKRFTIGPHPTQSPLAASGDPACDIAN